MQLLCVGEAMAELRQEEAGFAVGFAGDSFNTAIYCSRVLKNPGAVGYLTRIGRDPLSQGFLRLARAEGLDCTSIGRDQECDIGIYAVQTDDAGERSFHYWRAASAARRLFQEEDDFAPLGRCKILFSPPSPWRFCRPRCVRAFSIMWPVCAARTGSKWR